MSRARSPSAHPWLDGRFAEVDGLSATTRIYTFLAGHTAAGDLAALAEDWACLDEPAQVGGLEAVLQTHLFAGYPRTINALAALHGVGVSADAVATREAAYGDWAPCGERLCRRIYGDSYARLRRRIQDLDADFDRWMVETGYGRVLSRPGLSLRDRELCVIAVLAGQNVAPQLRSHLLGAARAGATVDQCRAVLDQTAAVWGDQAQERADAVWTALAAKLRALEVALRRRSG